MTRSGRRLATLYERVLVLYPADFRSRYRDELVATFEAGLSEAGGWLRRGTFVALAFFGALRHGVAERRARAAPFAGWGRDLRLGTRSLRRRPGFAATVGAVAALAVTAATLAFAVVDGTLLRSSPHADPERTVIVWGRNAQNGQLRDVVSGSNYIDLRAGGATFEHMAAIKPDDITLLEEDRPRVVPTLTATWEFFDVLGVDAAVGRTFVRRDGLSGSEPVAVITHAAWRERFGAAPEAIGSRLQTNDGFVTVVGVLPEDFVFAARAELFVPLYDDELATYNRTSYDYWIVGLLRRGATIDQASVELEGVMQRIRQEDPRLTGWTVAVEPLHETVTEAVRPVLLSLAVAVGAMVLVAAANVAGLFLVHATSERANVAIESSLGAGFWRIARRLVTEVVVVCGIGGALGVVAAIAGLRFLPGMAPPFVAIPGSAAQVVSFRADFNVRAAVFAVAVTAIIVLAGSLTAVLGATARKPGGALASVDRSRSVAAPARRAHDLFVAAQVAFATLLLVVGLLAFGTVRNLFAVETGLDPEGVLTLYTGDLDDRDATERAVHFRRLLDGIEEVPGVVAVGVNDYVPLQAEDDFEGISLLDRPPPPPGQGLREEWRRVSEGYFAAAGVEIVAGRGFQRSDFENVATVVIVNEAFVRRHYPDGDAIGARVLIHKRSYGEATIVGVVGDVLRRGVRQPAPPVFYVPYHRDPRPNMAVFVRAQAQPEQMIEPVRRAIWSVDAQQPVDRIAALDTVVADAVGVPRLAMVVLMTLAGAAAGLSGLGLFGVLAYSVRARRGELGIRMALGATGGTLQRMVIVRSLLLSAAGAAVGAGLAWMAGRAAEPLVFGVSVADGAVVGGVTVVLLTVSFAASWLPARRVATIDPGEALRQR